MKLKITLHDEIPSRPVTRIQLPKICNFAYRKSTIALEAGKFSFPLNVMLWVVLKGHSELNCVHREGKPIPHFEEVTSNEMQLHKSVFRYLPVHHPTSLFGKLDKALGTCPPLSDFNKGSLIKSLSTKIYNGRNEKKLFLECTL